MKSNLLDLIVINVQSILLLLTMAPIARDPLTVDLQAWAWARESHQAHLVGAGARGDDRSRPFIHKRIGHFWWVSPLNLLPSSPLIFLGRAILVLAPSTSSPSVTRTPRSWGRWVGGCTDWSDLVFGGALFTLRRRFWQSRQVYQ